MGDPSAATGVFFLDLAATTAIAFGMVACLLEHQRRTDRMVTSERQRATEATRVAETRGRVLREVHHRVKNNLQLIGSLVNLQRRRSGSTDEHDRLIQLSDRISAIARAHDALHDESDASTVDSRAYFQHLVGVLTEMYEDRGVHNIDLTLQVDPVPMDRETAVRCGVIVNELVTNAFKHAFHERETGTIEVRWCRADAQVCELRVRDDGVGLPTDAVAARSGAAGLQLVDDFVQQLGGTLSVSRDTGTDICIRYPYVAGDAS